MRLDCLLKTNQILVLMVLEKKLFFNQKYGKILDLFIFHHNVHFFVDKINKILNDNYIIEYSKKHIDLMID